MKKNKKWLDNLVLIILFISLISLLYFNNTLREQVSEQTKLATILANLEETNKDKDSILIKSLKMEFFLNQNLKKSKIDSITSDGSKVLLIFSDETCVQCLVGNVMDFNFFDKELGLTNLILAGNFEKEKEMIEFLSGFKNVNKLLFKDISNSTNINLQDPIICVLNQQNGIGSVYVDKNDYLQLRKNYYKEILFNYFD